MLASTAFAVLAVSRTLWRAFRDNEELEPGGSMGRQMFGGRGGKNGA